MDISAMHIFYAFCLLSLCSHLYSITVLPLSLAVCWTLDMHVGVVPSVEYVPVALSLAYLAVSDCLWLCLCVSVSLCPTLNVFFSLC